MNTNEKQTIHNQSNNKHEDKQKPQQPRNKKRKHIFLKTKNLTRIKPTNSTTTRTNYCQKATKDITQATKQNA